MALNASVLGPAMRVAAESYDNLSPPADEAEMEARRVAYFNDLAAAILNHITSAGVINVTVNTVVTTPSGPGTGTGTGTGTIS